MALQSDVYNVSTADVESHDSRCAGQSNSCLLRMLHQRSTDNSVHTHSGTVETEKWCWEIRPLNAGNEGKKWSQCKQISQMMSLVNQMLLMNGLMEREREGGGGVE